MPVGIYMSEPPASIPEHWLMCKSRRFNTVSTTFPSGHLNPGDDSEFLPMRKMVELGNGTVVEDEWYAYPPLKALESTEYLVAF